MAGAAWGWDDSSLRIGKDHTARAQRVILLFMAGGPSQVDTFDPKPALAKLDGQDVPDSIAAQVPKIQRAGLKNILASPWKFRARGDSGIPISDLFPSLAQQADDLCVIRSMTHRNPVHGPGRVLGTLRLRAGQSAQQSAPGRSTVRVRPTTACRRSSS